MQTNLRHKKWISYVLMIIKYVLIMGIMVFLFRSLILIAYIPSSSMVPTLEEGDFIFSTKWDKKIDRHEIIIFKEPDGNRLLIKRVIGLPGEIVEIQNGIVKVNGEQIKESYIADEKSDYSGTFKVPEDFYFVLGDNRNHSQDSRYIGYIPKDSVEAVAKFRIYPLHKIGLVE